MLVVALHLLFILLLPHLVPTNHLHAASVETRAGIGELAPARAPLSRHGHGLGLLLVRLLSSKVPVVLVLLLGAVVLSPLHVQLIIAQLVKQTPCLTLGVLANHRAGSSGRKPRATRHAPLTHHLALIVLLLLHLHLQLMLLRFVTLDACIELFGLLQFLGSE